MRATALVAALALLWGSGYFWIKLALGGFTPLQLTFGRLALGAVVLLPIVVSRRLRFPRDRAMWGHLVVSALLACAVPYTLFALAEQSVSSSLAGVLNSTTPLWTVLLTIALQNERHVPRRRIVGIFVGLSGALILAKPWSDALNSSTIGILLCLGAALSYAIAYTYQSKFLTNRGFPPVTLTSVQLLIASALLATMLPFSGPAPSAASTVQWLAIVMLGTAGTGLALVINFTLLSKEGAIAASVVTYLVPAVAFTLGVVVLREPLGIYVPAGATIVILGVFLVRQGACSRPRALNQS